MKAIITTIPSTPDNIALAGKVLEKIKAFAACMGAEFFTSEAVKIDICGATALITIPVKLPVSALREYIARQDRQEEGASTQGGNPAPFELEIAGALEKIGLRVSEIKTHRCGFSNFALPGYIIVAGLPKRKST